MVRFARLLLPALVLLAATVFAAPLAALPPQRRLSIAQRSEEEPTPSVVEEATKSSDNHVLIHISPLTVEPSPVPLPFIEPSANSEQTPVAPTPLFVPNTQSLSTTSGEPDLSASPVAQSPTTQVDTAAPSEPSPPAPPQSSQLKPSPPAPSASAPAPSQSSQLKPSPPAPSASAQAPSQSSQLKPSPPAPSASAPAPSQSSQLKPSPPAPSASAPAPSQSSQLKPSPPAPSASAPAPSQNSQLKPSPLTPSVSALAPSQSSQLKTSSPAPIVSTLAPSKSGEPKLSLPAPSASAPVPSQSNEAAPSSAAPTADSVPLRSAAPTSDKDHELPFSPLASVSPQPSNSVVPDPSPTAQEELGVIIQVEPSPSPSLSVSPSPSQVAAIVENVEALPKAGAGYKVVVFPLRLRLEGSGGFSDELDKCIRERAADQTQSQAVDWVLVGVNADGSVLEVRYATIFEASDDAGIQDFALYARSSLTGDIRRRCNIAGVSVIGVTTPEIMSGGNGARSSGVDTRIALSATLGGIAVLAVMIGIAALVYGQVRTRVGGSSRAGASGFSSQLGGGGPALRFSASRDDATMQEIAASDECDTVHSATYSGSYDEDDSYDDSIYGDSERTPTNHSLQAFTGAWGALAAREVSEPGDEVDVDEGAVTYVEGGANEMGEHPHDYLIGVGPTTASTPLPDPDYVVRR